MHSGRIRLGLTEFEWVQCKNIEHSNTQNADKMHDKSSTMIIVLPSCGISIVIEGVVYS